MNVSISRIKAFKSCRRLYWLKYVEGLEPIEKPEALQLGSNYHELLEWLYNHGTLDGVEEDNSKELAMASAYWKYIYPKFEVIMPEVKFSYLLNDCYTLDGIVDGISKDQCLVEHKSTSLSIDEYEYNLQWDEQILAYMLATGLRKVHYTVCRKPTIRQKQNESDEAFYKRMVEWYDEDTDSKIRLLEIERTDEQVEQFRDELHSMCEEMQTTNFYRNSGWCSHWGRRCEYSSVCLDYDPNVEYVEFERSGKGGS